MRGIDISNWQDGLTPSCLPIDFCIVKATEGIGYTDRCCDSWVQDCIINNILWGFYHFARENEPEEEAEWFYNECKDYFGVGIPVLDYETSNYNNREWCERFINRLHDLSGIWCMLYISASRCGEYENSWIPDKCGLWVAGYPWEIPSYEEAGNMPYNIYPWPFAAIWQFTSSLQLNGWSLDGDIAYMDADAWHKYAGSNTPEPTPQPEPTIDIDELVTRVLDGEFGSGDERKTALGALYDEVQTRINLYYDIADEVINGNWGNGWNREQALNGAGYPYEIIQRIVNDKLS